MKCKSCGSPDQFFVLDTRSYGDQTTTTRRLECACGRRWTTIEIEKEGSAVMVDRHGHPLPVAAPTTGSRPPVVVGDVPPRPVAAAHAVHPRPVAAAPPLTAANPLPVVGGGVGGGLPSGSHPISLSPLSDPDPSVEGDLQGDRAREGRRWTSGDWLRRFGKAWSIEFCRGARHYGHAGDGKASGVLDDLIADLPAEDVLAAQERASAMFSEFFSDRSREVVKARHCFAWFVARWGGLRVPPADVEAGGRRAPVPRAVAAEQQTHDALRRHLDRQKEKVPSAG